MRLRLSEIEAFNFPDDVPNETAQRFLSHTTGSEEFEFFGEKRPKSVIITTVEFSSARSGVARGLLLSVDADTFFATADAESDQAGTFDKQEIVRRYCVGLLELKLEPVDNVSVTAKPAHL